jgi:hypothetical protein
MEHTACCTTHGRHHKKGTKLVPSFYPKSANISSVTAAAQLICPFTMTCHALSSKLSLTKNACHQEVKAPTE